MCSTTTVFQAGAVDLFSPSSEATRSLRVEADTRCLTGDEFSKIGPSVSALQSAIPSHCRERSLLRSVLCVTRDLLYITACATTHYLLLTSIPEDYALFRGGLWCVYIFWQGVFFTGIWVMGHECGHGAFSPYPLVNDCVGFVLHSALLVPYFSWQYSHARHHKFTNHITRGETHVASLKHELNAFSRIQSTLEEYGLDKVFPVFPIAMLLFGYPIYLFWNVSGGRVGYDGRSYNKTRPSHFNPEGGLFPPHMKEKVLLSVLGCAISLLIAAYCTTIVGFHNVMLWYGYPYLFTNGWLTLYTSLEHTHKDVPHYGDEAFTFIRGALTSIDRPSYGFFSSCFHHDVGDTHVLHHIDSRIPCYHAREATEAIKPVLGHYYREDNTPIVKAFLRAHRDCKFIRGLTGVQFYEPGQSAEFFGRSLRLPLEGALESTGVAAEANATPESEEVRKEIRDEIDHLVGAALRIRDDEVSTARGRLRRGPPVVGSTVLVYEAGIAGKGGTYNRQPYVVDDIFDGTTLKLSKVGEPSSVRTSHYLNVRPYYGSSAGHVLSRSGLQSEEGQS